MTSLETAEDRMGKMKVTANFFKKLGEKLRNQRRYQNLEQLSDLSSTRSDLLDSTKGHQPARSVTDTSKQSENNITSNEGSSFTAITSSSMRTDVKSIDNFHDGIKTLFSLGNNNVLSILKSKNDPKMVIYDLKNQNGCKIHLEKMSDRAMMLSVDNNGKRLHISCNF